MANERGEFAFINWIRRQVAVDPRVTIGIGDDMAEVRLPAPKDAGGRVLVGTDAILDGVHFDTARDALADVGWKAVAVNLSDVAAMAGVPLCAVATVALPRQWSAEAARDLFGGMRRCADQFACAWVGGDVTAWDRPLAITVTVLATAERPVCRSGARSGHLVCVTGELGGSLRGHHLRFTPRVAEARRLAEAMPIGAMIDLSDGLSSDVGHVCDESGVGVLIEAAQVPVSEAARRASAEDGRSPLEHALSDGEDFELLFTVDASEAARLEALDLGVAVSVIGRIVEAERGRAVVDTRGQVQPLRPEGYEHWRQ